jgi:late competence protein required for DNA uptake (superfamily II DNA/RNA helicase)
MEQKLIFYAIESALVAKITAQALQKIVLTPEQLLAYKTAYEQLVIDEVEVVNSRLGLTLSKERLISSLQDVV